MTRVFVVHDTGQYNFAKAAQFGDLVVCAVGKVNVHSPDTIRLAIRNALSGFKEADFLLLVGTVVQVFFAGLCLPSNLSKAQLLLWDVKRMEYFVRVIDLP